MMPRAVDGKWSVVWCLGCDEYHGHRDTCYYRHVVKTKYVTDQRGIISRHRTKREAVTERGRLDDGIGSSRE